MVFKCFRTHKYISQSNTERLRDIDRRKCIVKTRERRIIVWHERYILYKLHCGYGERQELTYCRMRMSQNKSKTERPPTVLYGVVYDDTGSSTCAYMCNLPKAFDSVSVDAFRILRDIYRTACSTLVARGIIRHSYR